MTNITEPTYTYDQHALAGSHARPGRQYRVTHRTIMGDPFPKDVHTTTVTALPERETLAVAADMVRRALDVETMSARDLLPIMRHTANMVKDPRDVTYRSAAMALGMGSGDVDAVTSTFDPWAARQHATRVTRSRKGRTSFKRDRVSMAPVIGDHHSPAGPMSDEAVSDEACMARDSAALQLMGARRLRLGVNALDVQRATDHHYRPLGVPALVGSDATSWASTTNGDRTSRTSVASHRSGIDGTASHSTTNVLAAPGEEYSTHTADGSVAWPLRGERSTGCKTTKYTKAGKLVQNFPLPSGRDRDLDPADTRVFVCHPTDGITSRWSLVAPNIDVETRWQGHELVKRASVKRESRKTDAKRVKSVDIGTVDAPTTVDGWRELLDNLNRHERITARSADGRVTISRNAQRYMATDSRGATPVKWTFRTVDAMAKHLATA